MLLSSCQPTASSLNVKATAEKVRQALQLQGWISTNLINVELTTIAKMKKIATTLARIIKYISHGSSYPIISYISHSL